MYSIVSQVCRGVTIAEDVLNNTTNDETITK